VKNLKAKRDRNREEKNGGKGKPEKGGKNSVLGFLGNGGKKNRGRGQMVRKKEKQEKKRRKREKKGVNRGKRIKSSKWPPLKRGNRKRTNTRKLRSRELLKKR